MDQGDYLDRIPAIILTGFLGSGKTSMLMDLIQRYNGRYSIAVVQNEFAPGHVDGFTLRKTGLEFSLLEINNGSLFCACLLGDFMSRLIPFLDKNKPDVLIIEATGLADPLSLGQIFEAPALKNKVYLARTWCLVDALYFQRIIDSMTRARHQIRIADTVWINKTDLVDNTLRIEEAINAINPFARILKTTYGSTEIVNLPEEIILSRFASSENSERDDGTSVEIGFPKQSRPNIGSCVVRSTHFFDEQLVKDFLFANASSLQRIKGYIRTDEKMTLAVQGVLDQVQIASIEGYTGPSELIAIAENLDKREFSKLFLNLKKP